jgi:hypothetical protein
MKYENIILTDAHVHIHDCFDINFLLNTSHSNFNEAAKSFSAKSFEGVLCLTESFNVNYFEELQKKAVNNRERNNYPGWNYKLTEESNSLRISNDQNKVIYIIAGRQIVTKEKLEVLGIGVTMTIDDGKSIEEVVELVNNNKGLPVIPWGVGKWTGNRKKIINNIVNNYKDGLLFIGDNGNRPFFWRKPSVFAQAERLNIRNLPGTDPLPLKTEVSRAGKYGLVMEGKLDPVRPYESLRGKILNPDIPLLSFGQPERALRFIRNQVLIRFAK